MSDLSVQQLKEYLKNVFDLEGALYQHNQLVDGYSTRRNENLPAEPDKYLPKPPSKPVRISSNILYIIQKSQKMQGLIFICAFTGIFGFPLLFDVLLMIVNGDGFDVFGGLGFVFVPVSLYYVYHIIREKKAQQEIIEAENQTNYQKYEQALEEYHTAVAEMEEKYSDRMKKYPQEFADYNRETNDQIQKFDEVKATLQTSLTKLYSQNIVYAKYRNIVAIAAIYEYFDSGRCTELEGPNGAYNMYEGELRSNIIISSLSQIVSDLEQIKNGQYALYEQICQSNEKVEQILDNIYNAQILTAYYAEAAAIAAAADKITYSVIL